MEDRISTAFPGCKQNLNWLIRHLFIEDAPTKPENIENAGAARILDWILLTVRSWDVPELTRRIMDYMFNFAIHGIEEYT